MKLNLTRKNFSSVINFVLIFIFLFSCSVNIFAKKIKPNSVYVINLQGTLIEHKERDKFSDMLPALLGMKPNYTIGLNHVLKNIHEAGKSPNIIGIYLYNGNLSAGYGMIKEIRNALIDFKKSGKFIVAYADNYLQSNYYLASVADKVMFNPYGTLDIKGLSTKTTFYKNAIDKLGIDMQVVKVGTFKSAVEPYTNTEMSEANRVQMTEFLNSIWKNLSSEMAVSRKITSDSINILANQYCGLQPNDRLRASHLIDTLVYIDETDSILNGYSAYKQRHNKIGHNAFTEINRKSINDKNKIAILYVDGAIGESNNEINAKSISRICKELELNNAVKAVVVRVNSPGGSAFESEKIWRAFSKLKEKKPIIVSMGNYAASGGYYISCMANKILAQPTTITESIGIFGVFPNMKGINDKIGLSYDGVKTNKMSDAFSTHRAFTDEERALLQENVNRGYELFVKRCADGRKKTMEEIKAIAQGRIWSGEDALKIGLVDELGGLYDAVKVAALSANINTYQLVVASTKSKSNKLGQISIEQKIEENILKNKLGDYYQLFKELNEIQQRDKIQARLLFDFNDL